MNFETSFATAAAILCFCAAVHAADLPNPAITPGAVNPEVTQENIDQTICVKGYTKTIRPPAYFTNKLKLVQIFEYGYSNTNMKDFEEDHLIPLEIGGAPTDSRNLWPQPRDSQWSSKEKDKMENALHRAICRHQISLKVAQEAFAHNWVASYKRYEHLISKNSQRDTTTD